MPNMGLELLTPRSRVACSTHWASQAPPNLTNLNELCLNVYVLQPQRNQSRNQNQKDNRKICKHFETNHSLLNNPQAKESQGNPKKYIEQNENGNTIYQNLCFLTKVQNQFNGGIIVFPKNDAGAIEKPQAKE